MNTGYSFAFAVLQMLFVFPTNATANLTTNTTTDGSIPLKKCVYINSYHKGYEWSDGIEAAAYATVKNVCKMQSFYMDTKRNDTAEFAKKKGIEVKAWILTQKPDIVIVADDAAVEYVLMAHFKNHSMPFVFCGINWEAKKYGLPYKNATGMIEVAPVESLADQLKEVLPRARRAVYLSGDVESDRVNHTVYAEFYKKQKITLQPAFAKTMKEWKSEYIKAQSSDVVILANYVGIEDWSYDEAKAIVKAHSKKISLTYHEFMRPLTTLSLTKLPSEQGEWAGKVAVEILKGSSPEKIPVAVNRRWNLYVNDEIAALTKTVIPEAVVRKASKISL